MKKLGVECAKGVSLIFPLSVTQFWADMLNKRKWAILLAVILIVASGAAFVEYLTHYVMPMSIVVPDDYPTIQAAIGNCTPGSTIHVRNGIYNGLLTIDKPLDLNWRKPRKYCNYGSHPKIHMHSTISSAYKHTML